MSKRKKGLTPYEKQQKEIKKQKNRRKRMVENLKRAAMWSGIVLVAASLLAGVLSLSVKIVRDTGLFLRNRTALSSERYEVDSAMLSYYFYETYRELLENDKAEVSVYDRLDPALPLKEQAFSGDETWFDYFMKKTTERVSEMLRFAEGAADADVVLTEEDEKKIEGKMEEIRAQAEKESVSASDFIASRWGRGVKEKDLRRAMELQLLSDKHYASLDTVHTYTDAELDAYYKENRHLIDRVDYKYFTLASDYLSFEELRVLANQLSAAKDAAAFDAWLMKNVAGLYHPDSQPTEDEIQDVIRKTNVKNYTYEKGDKADDFLFAEGNKIGDTKVIDNGVEFTVYMIVSLPKREEYPAVNLRQVLVDILQYDSDADAKTAADEIFARCKKGMSEAEFIELAVRYSQSGAGQNGGLLSNVTKFSETDDMQPVIDWCFAERKAGDIGLVKTETYGYHILYYIGTGEAAWKVAAREMMQNEAFDTMELVQKEYLEKYKVEINQGACDAVAAPTAL